jgi:hypothetical protein
MKKFLFLVIATMLAFTSCEKNDDANAWIYGTWKLNGLTLSNGKDIFRVPQEAFARIFGTMEFDESGSCKIVISGDRDDNLKSIETIYNETFSYSLNSSDLKVGKYSMKYSYDGEEFVINGDGSFLNDLTGDDSFEDLTSAVFTFKKQ